MSKIFITGGTGCIGASAIHNLLTHYGSEIESIIIVSRTGDPKLMKIWLGDSIDELVESGKLQFVAVDIGDSDALEKALQEHQPTHIMHLGALQSPDCDSTPAKGVEINVLGTLNLFAAVEKLETKVERFVFASSAAVYGKRSMYAGDIIPESETLAPPNYYGVWKVAGEHLAALFHERSGIPTVSLRLNTTYGPGRDRGKTSAPTVALKSIALGSHDGKSIAFRMPYQGRENYHYVEDVGAHFAGVCMLPFEGCEAFNIKGKTIPVTEFLEIASSVATELGMNEIDLGVEEDASPNLFICDLDDQKVDAAFPGLPKTPIEVGVRKSLETFQKHAAAGELKL
ncbi:NAD-dependent epimerase/dehydratase family protein [Mariniblastus fucicola]|uniref:dTDP-glucose 4,6-dehydratase 2 n=1 Tax=Mariniblastus fucicola TaxID=980251 RepID=A0A5B9PE81_9BACT|nr:NAD(P)-dependent oxidoreductase [Mariniblastus fucicola]QEG23242.1 dTDP-glucose 4,6-dehydratase 2 [Mariniblastus fucicola]